MTVLWPLVMYIATMAGYNIQLTLARLNSLSLNERELRSFLETDVGKQINSKISIAVRQYMRMMEELQYMEEKLPGLYSMI